MKTTEKIDRLLCEFADPDIAYEDQSAPMLDSSWAYAFVSCGKCAGYAYSCYVVFINFSKANNDYSKLMKYTNCDDCPRRFECYTTT